MATGTTPARILLSSSPEGNLTMDFINRDEAAADNPAPAPLTAPLNA
jgi:type VI secretion system protein VasG